MTTIEAISFLQFSDLFNGDKFLSPKVITNQMPIPVVLAHENEIPGPDFYPDLMVPRPWLESVMKLAK